MKAKVLIFLVGTTLFFSCSTDNDPSPDPCENTDLIVTAFDNVFAIVATASGGKAPYQYSIDGNKFQSSGSFENLEPKEYAVTVRDANDCISTVSITVEDVCSELSIQASVEYGEIFLIVATASGGTAPYQFSLNGVDFQESETFLNVEEGTYTVTIKDANNCTVQTDIEVEDPCVGFSVSAKVEEYSVKATVTGGTAPFEYSLDGINFQNSPIFSNIETADILIVKDANGCKTSVTINTSDLSTMLDERDDQRYKIIKIGNQIWLGENFNYNSNTASSTTSWCYDNDPPNCETYGRMYTWDAANQVAPEGWKLPSPGDWQVLFKVVAGTVVHHDELINGSFQAALGGYRVATNNIFVDLDEWGYYWSSGFASNTDDSYRLYGLRPGEQGIFEYSDAGNNGISVRYIKIQ